MSIATDINLSCLQDLVDYLQWQDLRHRSYTLSPHFHDAIAEFCDTNHLPHPDTKELHPPTHVSGLLHHSSVVSLLSHLPSYRQKDYLYFLVVNVDEEAPTQKKVRYADSAAIGHASRKSSTSSVSSASSRPHSASRPYNQRTLSAQRPVKLVQTDQGLWPDSASMDNFSCSTHDYVTDAHFHPCMIVEQAHLKQPPTWSHIAAKANVAPDFQRILVTSAVACYLIENRDTPFHFMEEQSVYSTYGIHPKHALEYDDAEQNVALLRLTTNLAKLDVVGIAEIGLDYMHTERRADLPDAKDCQHQILKKILLETRKMPTFAFMPLIMHIRDITRICLKCSGTCPSLVCW